MARNYKKQPPKPRVGPAGKGKFYVQAHSWNEYRRLNNKRETQELIEEGLGELEEKLEKEHDY